MNYIAKHWRGELSLPVSVWVNGALVSALSRMVDKWFESLLEDLTLDITIALVVAWLSAIMIRRAVYVWQIVGIWRSATRYQRDPTHKWAWGNVAKFMVVIGGVASIVKTVQAVIQ